MLQALRRKRVTYSQVHPVTTCQEVSAVLEIVFFWATRSDFKLVLFLFLGANPSTRYSFPVVTDIRNAKVFSLLANSAEPSSWNTQKKNKKKPQKNDGERSGLGRRAARRALRRSVFSSLTASCRGRLNYTILPTWSSNWHTWKLITYTGTELVGSREAGPLDRSTDGQSKRPVFLFPHYSLTRLTVWNARRKLLMVFRNSGRNRLIGSDRVLLLLLLFLIFFSCVPIANCRLCVMDKRSARQDDKYSKQQGQRGQCLSRHVYANQWCSRVKSCP